jgi:uncharacterized protein
MHGTGALLAELSSAGRPWLAIDMAGSANLVRSPGDVTVIDIADPYAAPVTVNPLEPGPGYPVQAHSDRLAGLFEAAFGPAEPVAAALRAGLRRTYANCGWDPAGAAAPGTVMPPAVPLFRQLPAVPLFRQLRVAVMAAAEDLGFSTSMRAAVRAFLRARLDALWAGPAGRFLEGGHPVDVGSLQCGRVLVTGSGVADDDAASFLAGVLLVRLAEQLRPRGGPGRHNRDSCTPQADQEGSRFTVVIAAAGHLTGASLRGAGWFGRLLDDLRSCGADIIMAGPHASARKAVTDAFSAPGAFSAAAGASPAPAGASSPAGADHGETVGRFGPPVLAGRRSAACGERCGRRPCDGYELHAAGLLAHDDGQAWLRLWVQTLVLAFLTGRPLPHVPVPLQSGWRTLSPRRRECVLATVIDGAVTVRATALRPSYDPRFLMSVVRVVTTRTLDAGAPLPLPAGAVWPRSALPFRAGHVWVIPQLRWLHEIERLNQAGLDPDDIAPPLDFALSGLLDWPGIRVMDRLSGLRRHPLSLASERNRQLATIALLGVDGPACLHADLATAGIGLSPQRRLRHAAALMGVGGPGEQPGWLEAVLSWPQQYSSGECLSGQCSSSQGSSGQPGTPASP